MKGFVVSRFFPPINSSEGLETFKLLKNSKFKYDVFTQKSNTAWSYGNRDINLLSKNIQPVFSESDSLQEWAQEAFEYYDKHKEDYSFIMTRSMAPEAHEVGLAIKKKYPNVKWIASFGEPIFNNPYNLFSGINNPYRLLPYGFENTPLSYMLSPKRMLKSLIWKMRNKKFIPELKKSKLEKDVFLAADIIVLNNEYQKGYMLKNYPKGIISKTVILPLSFDESLYNYSNDSSVSTHKRDKYIMTYLGHLDEIRNVNLFFKALSRIKKNRPELLHKVEINFYGNMSISDKASIIDCGLTDVVKVRDSVTYLESLQIMLSSDLLLLFDANLGEILNENIFFAAKLADYIGAKKAILGITMLDGASADILKKINANVATFSEDDIYNNLVYILVNGANKLNDKIEEFNSINVAKKYDAIVEELYENF